MDSELFVSISMVSIISLALLWPPTNSLSGNETDRLALVELKARITYDPYGFMRSWNDTNHFCRWYGVTCSRRHQRVTKLDLSSLKITGSISPHIGNLSFLQELLLHNNSLTDHIPSEVGRLRRLQRILIENNSFTGEIPANLSKCSNLVSIDFSSNKLIGEVPSELGSLTRLQYFIIIANILRGRIPAFLGNFSSLVTLSLSKNNFHGQIPEALGRLTSLSSIDLGFNNLSGVIPPSLFNMSSITYFAVNENRIQGTLPMDLGSALPNLEQFTIGSNQFMGNIPVSLSNATNLLRFAAPRNQLRGNVPDLNKLNKLQWLSISINQLGTGKDDLCFLSSLTNATNLQLLAFNNNFFRGLLPDSVGNLSRTVRILSLSSNQISGTIPSGLQNLVNLEILYLFNNELTGTIPVSIGMLTMLQDLDVQANYFTGTIPSSLGNLSLLTVLYLATNNLRGSIPSNIGKCQQLFLLDLSFNNLSGDVPKEVIGLSSLAIYLNLSNNYLSGSLPIEVGSLKNLGELDVSDNMLSGGIPGDLGGCTVLEILRMQGNFLEGAIPSAFSSLRGLRILDLSENNLTGQIPTFLENMKFLTQLNLSDNDFDGRVPLGGVFNNSMATSITGNSRLCGGIPEFKLPKCRIKTFKSGNKRTVKIIVSAVAGLLAITLMAMSVLFLLKCGKNRLKLVSTLSLSTNSHLRVSYKDLHRATDGFSSTNLIGSGRFGYVYKGILGEGGQVVAIKVLNLQHRGAARSFMAECETLRNIRHRNLVKIITTCSSLDNQGNDFKALVYEFMVKGSLEEWLHPPPVLIDTTEEAELRNLNFLQRVNIAIDVISALEYLHHQCEAPIVHCDLKPSNVLLDSELTGHVSDFGLAKFLPEYGRSGISGLDIHSNSIGIRGTIGYVPPEYGLGSEVSASGDMYSFGILLLEMFTGKRPTNDMFKDGWNLSQYAKAVLPNEVARIADPILLQEAGEGEWEANTFCSATESKRRSRVMECMSSVIEIGVLCSAESPGERLNISDVTTKLHTIRNILLKV